MSGGGEKFVMTSLDEVRFGGPPASPPQAPFAYNPGQPRVPAGSPEGGEWGGGGGGPSVSPVPPTALARYYHSALGYIADNGPATASELAEHLRDRHRLGAPKAKAVVEHLARQGDLARGTDEYGRAVLDRPAAKTHAPQAAPQATPAPVAPRPTPVPAPASPPAGREQREEEALLAEVRSLLPRHPDGMVPISQVRKAVAARHGAAAAGPALDDVLLRLRYDDRVRLIVASDLSALSPEDRAGSVQGMGELYHSVSLPAAPGGLPRKPSGAVDALHLIAHERYSYSQAVPVAEVAHALGVPEADALRQLHAARGEGLSVSPGRDGKPTAYIDKGPGGLSRLRPEPTTATPAQKAAVKSGLEGALSGVPAGKLVPVHELRAKVSSPDKAAFDDAARALWREGKVRLVSLADLQKATVAQLDASIPGTNETFFYLEPTASAHFSLDGPDLSGLGDLLNLSRQEVLDALFDAALDSFDLALPDAAFYSPDQPRDELGRWTSGGGVAGAGSAEDRPKAAEAMREQIAVYAGLGISPVEANQGDCSTAAREAIKAIRAAGGQAAYGVPENNLGHVWVVAGGRHYDVQAPDGVDDPKDLPFFREEPDLIEGGWRSTADDRFGRVPALSATNRAGGIGRTPAEHAGRREAAADAVRAFAAGQGTATREEAEALAGHLARLTVAQIHALKAEHGLKGSAPNKAALVAKLAERFRAHREKNLPEFVSTGVDKGAGGPHNTPVGRTMPTGVKAMAVQTQQVRERIGTWVPDDGPNGGHVEIDREPRPVGHELPEGTVVGRRVDRRSGIVTYTVRPREAEAQARYERAREISALEEALRPRWSDAGGQGPDRGEALRRLADLDPVRYRAAWEEHRAAEERRRAETQRRENEQRRRQGERQAAVASAPYGSHAPAIAAHLEASGLPAAVTAAAMEHFVKGLWDGDPDPLAWEEEVKGAADDAAGGKPPDFVYRLTDAQRTALGRWAGVDLSDRRKVFGDEPHTFTLADYLTDQGFRGKDSPAEAQRRFDAAKPTSGARGEARRLLDKIGRAREHHRAMVQKSLTLGHHVAPEVLADYPGLAGGARA